MIPSPNVTLQARSGIACLQLNDSTGRAAHPAQDVYRLLLNTSPDSGSVDITELIASCQMPANTVNGGGRFQISQEAKGLIMRFDPTTPVPSRPMPYSPGPRF